MHQLTIMESTSVSGGTPSAITLGAAYIGGSYGAAAGAEAGFLEGAELGSIVGPEGTLAGAVIGAVVGGAGGAVTSAGLADTLWAIATSVF